MEKNKKKKIVNPTLKRAMLQIFILMFPCFLITLWAALMTNLWISISSILLFFFQAVLIKNFVDGHYRLSEEE